MWPMRRRSGGLPITLPQGYSLGWSVSSNIWNALSSELLFVVPLTWRLIFLPGFFFLNFPRMTETVDCHAFMPSRSSGDLLIWFMGQPCPVAVAVGFHWRCGVAAETGVINADLSRSALSEAKDRAKGRPLYTRGAICRDYGRALTAYPQDDVTVVAIWQAFDCPILWGAWNRLRDPCSGSPAEMNWWQWCHRPCSSLIVNPWVLTGSSKGWGL